MCALGSELKGTEASNGQEVANNNNSPSSSSSSDGRTKAPKGQTNGRKSVNLTRRKSRQFHVRVVKQQQVQINSVKKNNNNNNSRSTLDRLVHNYEKRSSLGGLKLGKLLVNVRDIRKAERENADRLQLIFKRFGRKLMNWAAAHDDPEVGMIVELIKKNFNVTSQIFARMSEAVRRMSEIQEHHICTALQVPRTPRKKLNKVELVKKQFLSSRRSPRRHHSHNLSS